MGQIPHQKHTKLNKPIYGQFGRYEIALLGAPCDRIKILATQFIRALSAKYEIAYVDADHKAADPVMLNDKMPVSANVYSDKIDYHRFEFSGAFNRFKRFDLFNDRDLIFINGNHFTAQYQIVILDPRKKDSLERKLDRLSNVQMVLTTDEVSEPYDFLEGNLPDNTPTFYIEDLDGILGHLTRLIQLRIPGIKGLVLAGGKSRRMGKDKTQIKYHQEKPQALWLADLLDPFCTELYLSVRPDQNLDSFSDYQHLRDRFIGLGPYGAILTAFQHDPNSAWLVVASDLPLLTKEAFDYLLEHRNPSKIATAFHNPKTGFPEPLITIWEPKSYPVLLGYLGQGFSCPRKVLINADIEMLDIPKPDILENVNTLEDLDKIRIKLKGK
jgi:molybdopterin-guanine dinucleotide biosynthesis protein A